MADEKDHKPERKPIPPELRKRLQACYEHGSKLTMRGEFDYATEMFTQCVNGDPGNLLYVNVFLKNLFMKYKDNKKGANFAGLKVSGARSAAKKAASKEDWAGTFKAGLEGLKANPWDGGLLSVMASACQECGFDEVQLAYLKAALDADSKDPDINRQCALALARQGKYDEAIACWVRVQQAKPGDQEAQRAISDLTVEKTIATGGYESGKGANKAGGASAVAGSDEGDTKLTREQELQRAIKRNPADIAAYTELADIHSRRDEHDQVIKLLTTALQASGGDLKIRESLEDAQLRVARRELDIAESRAKKDDSPDSKKLLQRKKAEINGMELEVYRSRSQRYPNNPALKYELGLRLKRAGNFTEAITALQEARNDPKHRGHVFLELGECFQHIKQYKLALNNYGTAIDALSERDVELRKLSLYRAGKLAFALKDKPLAEKYLTSLAGLDFGYKDVADLLRRLSEHDGNGSAK